MKTWSFFDLAAGEFTGATYSGEELEANTPPGCEAREGIHLPPADPRIAARAARRAAIRQIERLEAAQARPLRELAIDSADESARARLRDLDARITALRNSLPPPVE